MASRYWHAKDEALLKIANLAIHLTDKSGVFEPNKENHLKPIIAITVIDQLLTKDKEFKGRHHTSLLERIANDLKIDKELIMDFELNVIDS